MSNEDPKFTDESLDWPEGKAPSELGILPLRNSVFFPGMIINITVGRETSKLLIDHVVRTKELVGLVTQRDPATHEPTEADLFRTGTAARVAKVIRSGDNYNVIVQGVARFTWQDFVQKKPFLRASVQPVNIVNKSAVEVQALIRNLRNAAREVIRLMPELPSEAALMLDNLTDAGQLADVIAANLDIPITEKQEILEVTDLKKRLETVLDKLNRQFEILKLSNKIQSQVKDEMDKSQREYYLRQQLKAIKEELGESDATDNDLEELEKQINEAGLPTEVAKVARKEFRRLSTMRDSSPEYTIARTYLDWIVELPWTKRTDDKLDLKAVRDVLDADHYGLDKVKKRIVEYLAVRKLKADMKGPILCLIGPPGVGKTSLGKSIAQAMGRNFHRISLGGVRDEAEIRGHRRTYIGAMPGKIVQGMKKAATVNPVLMLDEIDKLGSDFRGDPSSALLEVLDPEQNNSFMDHYLNVAYDLSKVLFIATGNQIDTIPPALRDRMEVIEIPGYTIDEKVHIARRHLIPKQLAEHGISEMHMTLTDAVLDTLISEYTREAGVRNLERQIAAVCRATAVDVSSAEGEFATRAVVPADIIPMLGPPKFEDDVKERVTQPGIATGLAWTPVGGDLIFIEATRFPGKGAIHLTGQLGDVMKESAHAAFSFLRANSLDLGLPLDFSREQDVHIHIPAGAIPKDGPSAGVTMFTALVSLFTGIKTRDDLAMTGEITMRGLVLPVGGIKEKVLAAHRRGIRTVILPQRNQKDLVDVPEKARNEMTFVFVKNVSEVLEAALERRPRPIGRLFAAGDAGAAGAAGGGTAAPGGTAN